MQGRTHHCGELRLAHKGQQVKLVGWYENMRRVSRNLGFMILRDFYGTTQIVIETEEMMAAANGISYESTVEIVGVVRERSAKNLETATGEIEVVPSGITVLGKCRYQELPFPIRRSREADENVRLKYRYLDLRNPEVKSKMVLRSKVIERLRAAMTAHDFLEITTPILTCSSPEGARDYLVPARNHPGKFYALPQAPQQFKQILMVSGFDRYFQIAPCFRDEDARADRSPGEFYQLDMEMAFASQEDVFAVIEEILPPVFAEYGIYSEVSKPPFVRIPYAEAMERYGSDKPDLRISLEVQDVTKTLADCGFAPFAPAGAEQAETDAVPKPCAEQTETGAMPKSSAMQAETDAMPESSAMQAETDAMPESSAMQTETDATPQICIKAVVAAGFAGTRKQIEEICAETEMISGRKAYWFRLDENGELVGGIAKFVRERKEEVIRQLSLENGDLVVLCAGERKTAQKTAGVIRKALGDRFDAYKKKNRYEFCWIVDFPMYEIGEESGRLEFCHNPFSMPQNGAGNKKSYAVEYAAGGTDVASGTSAVSGTNAASGTNVNADTEIFAQMDPLDMLAYQYDLVCNGVELSSGAVRNHDPELMVTLFEKVGLSEEDVKAKFPAMYQAFCYGAPPHAGIAPGIERMLMLLSGEESIREVIPFPMNKHAQDVMMGAPAVVDEKQLWEVHIRCEKDSAG
ncbi:MAG: aspartate--tRNA ligase [bacterium]|nr:aspartate--tRNA ligase [bacterium]